MNRAERRRITTKKKNKNMFLENSATPIDRRAQVFCHRHQAMHLDNIDDPSERDKKKIEAIRLKIKYTDQGDGTTKITKHCPRCFVVIEVDIIKKALIPE